MYSIPHAEHAVHCTLNVYSLTSIILTLTAYQTWGKFWTSSSCLILYISQKKGIYNWIVQYCTELDDESRTQVFQHVLSTYFVMISATFTRALQVYLPRTLGLTAAVVINRRWPMSRVPSSLINSSILLVSTVYGASTSVHYVTKATFQHQHQQRLKCATSKWNTSRTQPTFFENCGTTSTKSPNNNNNTQPNITPLPPIDTENIDDEDKTNLKHLCHTELEKLIITNLTECLAAFK